MCVMKRHVRHEYFGFVISDCRSEPIIDLLTNVLIVFAKRNTLHVFGVGRMTVGRGQ